MPGAYKPSELSLQRYYTLVVRDLHASSISTCTMPRLFLLQRLVHAIQIQYLSLPLPALHDSSNRMSDRRPSLLDLLLRQAIRHADLQCRRRMPLLDEILRRRAQSWRHGLQARDEDAVCE